MSLGGIHQYQANTASNTQALGNVKETIAARPAAQAQELMPGKVFEGMVTEVKNGQVTLGLSDGRTISARMEAGVALEEGQPMLFEVKSNTGEQISIRPVTLESAQNPTLFRALEAAGLKANPRNLSMVNQMMMEQLPIDKSSLQQMARAVANFPRADMQVLVQMQKLGIVITENSLNQFQNYQNGQQAILPDMQALMEGIANLPEQIAGKEGKGSAWIENFTLDGIQTPGAANGQNSEVGQILGLQRQMVEILLGDGASLSREEGIGQAMQQKEAVGQPVQGKEGLGQPMQGSGEVSHLPTGEQGNQAQPTGELLRQLGADGEPIGNASANPEAVGKGEHAESLQGFTEKVQQKGQEALPEAVKAAGEEIQNPIDKVLAKGQQENLTSMLQKLGGEGQLLPGGKLNTNLSAGELVQQIMGALEHSEGLKGDDVKRLFSSKEFKLLMKQAITEQWTLTPEQLKEEGAVKELYHRLSRQMAELQQALGQAGKEGAALAKTAQSVQNNLEFMNQLNQAYTYVQLPLKLQQQNAHSDLYVYTNKKNLQDKEGDLSALLHLDLDHLGSTDIYVKMHGSAVQADFYLADVLSFQLISNFTGQLSERLGQKGYHCEIKVENKKAQKNTVQEFLEQEKPAGKLHRYSFDVKA